MLQQPSPQVSIRATHDEYLRTKSVNVSLPKDPAAIYKANGIFSDQSKEAGWVDAVTRDLHRRIVWAKFPSQEERLVDDFKTSAYRKI